MFGFRLQIRQSSTHACMCCRPILIQTTPITSGNGQFHANLYRILELYPQRPELYLVGMNMHFTGAQEAVAGRKVPASALLLAFKAEILIALPYPRSTRTRRLTFRPAWQPSAPWSIDTKGG